jgi:hypothetical protein
MRKIKVFKSRGALFFGFPQPDEIRAMLEEYKKSYVLLPAEQEQPSKEYILIHGLGLPTEDVKIYLKDMDGYEINDVQIKHVDTDGVCNQSIIEVNGDLPEDGWNCIVKAL